MSALAPTLQAFVTDRLAGQNNASPNTIAAYRDSWPRLLRFASQQTRTKPSELDIAGLDAPLIAAFLEHLDHDRHNSTRTRNNRPAAIHSLFSTRPCDTPSTRHRSSACPPSRPSGTSATWSATSPRPNSPRCSQPATPAPGPAGATTPCSCWPPRPGSASQS